MNYHWLEGSIRKRFKTQLLSCDHKILFGVDNSAFQGLLGSSAYSLEWYTDFSGEQQLEFVTDGGHSLKDSFPSSTRIVIQ